MRLCSFKANDEARYGVIGTDGGIVDLTAPLGDRYPTLLKMIEADAVEKARSFAAQETSDYQEDEITYMPLYEEHVDIHCVGLNYAAHTAEAEMVQPDYPRTFIKTRAALVGHDVDYEMPTISDHYDFEGELAVIIGREARNIVASDAWDYVLGFSCFQDGSVRDFQQRTTTQGKTFEKSSSIGPCIVTRDDVGDINSLTLETLLNGERVQYTTFDRMIFSVPATIEYITHMSRLNPGDIIATGTPEGVGFKRKPPLFLKKGDRVDVVIEKVGTLSNTVA